MVFGFGFNKAKTFASAEKSVKQGKLNNAIADYEKISKEDPRDLNVLNTLGDLYARVGNVERATECFKRCGEAYASEGFTVKAIAMYKKVTKQDPAATDAVAKLAELYAQHGLYNDARVQYSQVVDQYLRNNQVQAAINILQKMLEFDPENFQLQGRMADLYVRMGKKAEARDLYFRSAQALRLRGSMEVCDKALASVLELEPGFAQALLLRGQVKLETEDAAGAVECLESLPDIDSRPEGLRTLLRAHLKLEHREEAEPLARKLLTVYNDPAGISLYAEALISAGHFDAALGLYEEYADRLLAADAAGLIQTLHALIGRVKDHSRSLEALSALFQKAGETTHLAEVTELLAHACVQEGELEKARDLYHKLAEMEPENPLHLQNYRQIMARLGEDPAAGSLAENEGAPAFIMEELEDSPAVIEQNYPPEIKAAIQDALTDAELFASYNLPARALPLLEAVLPRAPQDVRMNQRLASLYSRTGHFAEAARCCAVLRDTYLAAGHQKETREFSELVSRYRERAGLPPEAEPVVSAEPVQPQTGPESAIQEWPALEIHKSVQAATVPESDVSADSRPRPTDAAQVWETTAAPGAESEPAQRPALEMTAAIPEPVPGAVAHEIDLSEEWDRVLNAEQRLEPAAERREDAFRNDTMEELPASASPWDSPVPLSPPMSAAVGDLIEEARFYISQSMWEEARLALTRAEAMAPGEPALVELRAQLAPGNTAAPSAPEAPVPDLPAIPAPLPSFPEMIPAVPPEPAAPAPNNGVLLHAGVLDGFVTNLEQSLGPGFAISQPASDQALKSEASERVVPQPATQPDLSDPGAALSNLFAEFKRDMEASSEATEDIETHYNMGLAFKEMGLFDEAIAELQKAASAIAQGAPFPQVLETYTWLADCFVHKGVPEAGVHWYQKALAIPGLSAEQALAVHYELACAQQAAGDLDAARSHFMHVLSLNIDYRDVAERIKALKS